MNIYPHEKGSVLAFTDRPHGNTVTGVFEKAIQDDKFALGIFYIDGEKKPFEENIGLYNENKQALYQRETDVTKLQELVDSYKIEI